MHIIQSKLLNLAQSTNLANLTLRKIGEKIGEKHPQKIKHHLTKLIDNGFLLESSDKSQITLSTRVNKSKNLFFSIPILGTADCGPATKFAEENIMGYLKVSKGMLNKSNVDSLFAIKAVGNSMNRARVNGIKNIQEGDYVIVDKKFSGSLNNKYILAILGNLANIKKLIIDRDHQQFVLASESSEDFPPIYIHESDLGEFFINGEVVDVMKKPSNLQ